MTTPQQQQQQQQRQQQTSGAGGGRSLRLQRSSRWWLSSSGGGGLRQLCNLLLHMLQCSNACRGLGCSTGSCCRSSRLLLLRLLLRRLWLLWLGRGRRGRLLRRLQLSLWRLRLLLSGRLLLLLLLLCLLHRLSRVAVSGSKLLQLLQLGLLAWLLLLVRMLLLLLLVMLQQLLCSSRHQRSGCGVVAEGLVLGADGGCHVERPGGRGAASSRLLCCGQRSSSGRRDGCAGLLQRQRHCGRWCAAGSGSCRRRGGRCSGLRQLRQLGGGGMCDGGEGRQVGGRGWLLRGLLLRGLLLLLLLLVLQLLLELLGLGQSLRLRLGCLRCL
jgi:hypothetical protein